MRLIYMLDFNEKKGFICDMDGVIYHGNKILPGVADFINWLHKENKDFLYNLHLLYICTLPHNPMKNALN